MLDSVISIITPCYNVEKTLERYLLSVLNQTYKKIELIAIDDGSTDSTAEILKQYASKFEENGLEFQYVFQENKGLGGAINTGLKYVNGQYLCWSDPDDFYMIDSIEKRLKQFELHPECAVVSSNANVYSPGDLNTPLYREADRFEHRFEKNQFELLIREQSHFCAGCHMVKMSAFDEVNPTREIYQARRGQNWQMLLPLYYKYPRFYLDEPLYGYVLYDNSMSAGDSSEEKELFRWEEHEKILTEVLKTIPLTPTESKSYKELVTVRYAIKRFYTAIDYRDKKLLKEQYTLINLAGKCNPEIKKSFLRNYYLFFKVLFKIKDLWR